MSVLRTWAAQHGVSMAAIVDLEFRLGIGPSHAIRNSIELDMSNPPGSEARQQDMVRLEAAQKGVRLFRNNVGALPDKAGRFVRYGLANDSVALNKVLKSPDLVGWRKRVITPDMVGSVIAQTVLREIKEDGWTYRGDDHERAQLAFIELGIADGADACFCTGPGTL
jgi:hypothetical protein